MQGDGPSKPSPVVRRPLAPTGPTISPATMGASRAESVSTPARPAPMASAVRSPLSGGQVTLAYHHLAVAGIAVACLCVICFFLGRRFPGEVLPVTEKHPTFQEVRDKGVTGGLIAPPAKPLINDVVSERSGDKTGVAGKASATEKAPPPPEKAGVAEKAPPTGPQYRVRIAQVAVSQPALIDRMREYLSKKGIETELETRSGYYLLYSRDRYPDTKKSDEAVAQVKKALTAFEKETHIPVAKDAYVIRVKE